MATQAVPAPTTKPGDVGLRREMGLIGAMWASVTSIIGSGWLFGSWKASYSTGTSALLAWSIAGVMIIILALVHAELGGMYPVAGGTARFPHFAYGSVAGISFGFFSWLQAVTVTPIECFAVMQYLAYYWHGLFNTTTGEVTGLGFGISIALMAIFTAINFLAMRLFNRVNLVITWWKVIIPVAAIIVLFTQFHTSAFNSHGGFFPFGTKAMFAAIPSAGIVFAYLGFEQADQLAGEVRNPQKVLPRAIIGAILLCTVIYILLQVVFLGALRPGDLAHGWAGLKTNSNFELGPLAYLAGALGLGAFAIILRIDAFVSPSGTGLVYQTSTSRIGYGLARNRYYPTPFAWVDKNGVPWFSLIMAFVFGLVFLLPFPSWSMLVGFITSASVLMYAGAPLALGAFRRKLPDAARPYRLPGALVVSPLAFIIASLIIDWSGFEIVWKLGIAMVIGYVLIGIWMVYDKQRPPLDWKSATWLPVYLIGLGIISWQGQFGPDNTGRISFWLEMGIVAAFSLAIYIWAVFTCLPRDEIMNLIGRQSVRAQPQAASSLVPACLPDRRSPGAPTLLRLGRGIWLPTAIARTAVAQQHPPLDLLRRYRAECPAVHGTSAGVVRFQPPARRLAPSRPLDQQQLRSAGMPGDHYLTRTDPWRAAGPHGPQYQQPVAWPQCGHHGALGHRNPPHGPAHWQRALMIRHSASDPAHAAFLSRCHSAHRLRACRFCFPVPSPRDPAHASPLYPCHSSPSRNATAPPSTECDEVRGVLSESPSP